MSILKIEVGKPITLHVEKMEEVEGQFGPQLKFTAPGGDCVFVSKDAGYRQLERIGLTDDPAGAVLLFEKVQKGAKTYLNITPAPKGNGNGSGAKGASGAATTRQAGTTPAPTQPTPRQAVKDALDLEEVEFSDPLYLAITRFVLNDVRGVYGPTLAPTLAPSDWVAIAATLYIQAKRNG